MTRLIYTGPEHDARYLAALNVCFSDWGGEETFRWAFRRAGSQWPADLFMIAQDADFAAGSALTYRRLRLANGELVKAACMTGSWTLPSARGRGLFSHVIEVSREIAARQGCAILTAYVTAANASARRLAAAGAAMLPVRYHRMRATHATAHPAPDVIADFEQAWRSRKPRRNCVTYDYDKEQWLGQFVGRPWPVSALLLPNGVAAIVESHGDTDRLLEMSAADGGRMREACVFLAQFAAARGKKMLAYSSLPEESAALADLADTEAGFIAVFDLAGVMKGGPGSQPWSIANGDRM